VPVLTASGRRFDALTGEAPRDTIVPFAAASGQAWDEVHRRLPDRPRLWPSFTDFAKKRARELAPGDPIASVAVELLEQRIALRDEPPAAVRRTVITGRTPQTRD